VSVDEKYIMTELGWTEMELRWTAVVSGCIVDGWKGEIDGWADVGVSGRNMNRDRIGMELRWN
jgi:hypothetical protein